MSELLPCPFCGGKADALLKYNRTTGQFYIFVKCNVCSAQSKGIPSHERPDLNDWNSPECEEAVRHWNRREALKSK